MRRPVVLLVSFLALVKSQTTSVSQCTRNAGDLPINTYIEGCITPPCYLPQLQDAVINVVFRAPYTMRTMTTVATAYVSVFPVPYNLRENAVTCNFLTNTYCPVLKEEVIQYTLRMYIEPSFPVDTPVAIEFRVVDETSVPVICLRVNIVIAPPVVDGLRSNNGTLALDTAT